MLRELSAVLVEMQEALAPFSTGTGSTGHAGLRLRDAMLDLPLDLRVVFADGGPRLEADVPRSLADAHWRDGTSRIRLSIVAEAVPAQDEVRP
jgi:hypothetical protein